MLCSALEARYIPLGDQDFDLKPISATIDERGYNGQIRAKMGGAGLTMGFFRPADPAKPISFSLTTGSDSHNQVIQQRPILRSRLTALTSSRINEVLKKVVRL